MPLRRRVAGDDRQALQRPPARTIASVVCCIAAFAGARPTRAAPDDVVAPDASPAAVEFGRGQEAYEALRYSEAARHFEAAYRLDPDPAYLFNAAQAYRQGRDCAKALELFRRFQSVVPVENQPAKVALFVTDAESCAAEQARLAKSGERREPDRTIGWPKRRAGIITGAAGLAVVATGSYFAFRASSKAAEFDACEQTSSCIASLGTKYDQGKQAALTAKILLAGGGAILATGVVLYYLGHREWSEAIPPAVSVSVVPGGAVIGYQGSL